MRCTTRPPPSSQNQSRSARELKDRQQRETLIAPFTGWLDSLWPRAGNSFVFGSPSSVVRGISHVQAGPQSFASMQSSGTE